MWTCVSKILCRAQQVRNLFISDQSFIRRRWSFPFMPEHVNAIRTANSALVLPTQNWKNLLCYSREKPLTLFLYNLQSIMMVTSNKTHAYVYRDNTPHFWLCFVTNFGLFLHVLIYRVCLMKVSLGVVWFVLCNCEMCFQSCNWKTVRKTGLQFLNKWKNTLSPFVSLAFPAKALCPPSELSSNAVSSVFLSCTAWFGVLCMFCQMFACEFGFCACVFCWKLHSIENELSKWPSAGTEVSCSFFLSVFI